MSLILPQSQSRNTSRSDKSTGILLDSRTVLETKDFVTSGLLTYAEGDIVEIELPDYSKFELGQQVKLSIYSLGGIYTFMSSVIAKDVDVIVALIPPETQKKFVNRREHPRVQVQEQGLLIPRDAQHKINGQDPFEVQIEDISMGGIGFIFPSEHPGLIGQKWMLELTTGMPAQFEVEVVRHVSKDSGIFYGSKICTFPQEKHTALQAYILTRQIHIRSEQRKEIAKKRLKQGIPARS